MPAAVFLREQLRIDVSVKYTVASSTYLVCRKTVSRKTVEPGK